MTHEQLLQMLEPEALGYYSKLMDQDVRLWALRLRALLLATAEKFKEYGDPQEFIRDIAEMVCDDLENPDDDEFDDGDGYDDVADEEKYP